MKQLKIVKYVASVFVAYVFGTLMTAIVSANRMPVKDVTQAKRYFHQKRIKKPFLELFL